MRVRHALKGKCARARQAARTVINHNDVRASQGGCAFFPRATRQYVKAAVSSRSNCKGRAALTTCERMMRAAASMARRPHVGRPAPAAVRGDACAAAGWRHNVHGMVRAARLARWRSRRLA